METCRNKPELVQLRAALTEDVARFTSAFGAAQAEYHKLLELNDSAAAETLRETAEQVLFERLPILNEDAVIAIYGTGKVSHYLVHLLECVARNRKASIVFLHTKKQTGRVFYEYPVYNIRDASKAHLDCIIVATVQSADSICEQLKKAQLTDIPTDILPPEFSQLLEDYDANANRIRTPPPVKPGPNRYIQALEPFYIRRTGWQTHFLLDTFPEIRAKVLGVVEPGNPNDRFCGLPVYDQLPPANDGTPVIRELTDVLLACLRSGEHVEYRPVNMRVDASTVCQLNCTGCYMRLENNGTAGSGNLRLAQMESFLALNPGIKEIELSNSGEAFLNPELPDILALLHRHGIKAQFWNGVNFNSVSDRALRALVDCAVESITISIDGVTQEVYEQYRRNGRIDKVYANIRKLNDLKAEAHSDTPHLRWQFILMNHNQHEVEAAVHMAHELDMEIDFKPDWRGNFVPQNPEELSRITGMSYTDQYEYASQEGHQWISDVICGQMILSPQVNWDGRVLGCCNSFKHDWGINAFETPLGELFDNANYRAAVVSLLSGTDGKDHIGPCRECTTYFEDVISRHHRLALRS